jgi:hypothetical protein
LAKKRGSVYHPFIPQCRSCRWSSTVLPRIGRGTHAVHLWKVVLVRREGHGKICPTTAPCSASYFEKGTCPCQDLFSGPPWGVANSDRTPARACYCEKMDERLGRRPRLFLVLGKFPRCTNIRACQGTAEVCPAGTGVGETAAARPGWLSRERHESSRGFRKEDMWG